MAFFDLSFFQQLTTTFIGIVLGIVAALWIDRLIKGYTNKEQKAQLIVALEEALDRNIALALKVREGLNNHIKVIPTFCMDRTVFDATAYMKYDIIRSMEVCKAIDLARYELKHFDMKLDNLRIAAKDLQLPYSERADIEGSCYNHVNVVEKALNDVKKLLKSIKK